MKFVQFYFELYKIHFTTLGLHFIWYQEKFIFTTLCLAYGNPKTNKMRSRLLSNEILLILISDFAFNIHQYSEQLILPLINSLNHQQSKIRSATVKSMSKLLKISDPALLRKNLAYLVQRCFDENASVRVQYWQL